MQGIKLVERGLRGDHRFEKLLEQLVAMYEEKVSVTLADVVQQAKALRMKNVFALSRFFEIALKGTITWSKQLGGETIVATAEQRNTAKAHLETKIENLTAYCGFTVNAFSAATLELDTNVTVTVVTTDLTRDECNVSEERALISTLNIVGLNVREIAVG